MNIISIGDSIQSGTYKLHSRFRKVVNFSYGENLLSFVAPDIGNGPVNIVIDDISDCNYKQIIFSEKIFIAGHKVFVLKNLVQYNSCIEIPLKFDSSFVSDNIEILKSFLIENAPEKSLVFIFDNERRKYFKSSFEINFMKKILNGIDLINEGRISEGVKTFSGCGFGLTPSGDDFIVGLLSSLYTLKLLERKEKYSEWVEEILKNSKTENIISWNAIQFAGLGRVNEKLKVLNFALFNEDKVNLIQSAEQLIQTGSTSGADLLTGFLFTFAFPYSFGIKIS